jgi:hypothetical protein
VLRLVGVPVDQHPHAAAEAPRHIDFAVQRAPTYAELIRRCNIVQRPPNAKGLCLVTGCPDVLSDL